MTKQNEGENPAAAPALPSDVAEMVSQAQEQGISLREYIRRTTQSAIDTEVSKVKQDLEQTVSAVTNRQQAILEAGEEFDKQIADLVEQGAKLEGVDLVAQRNKYIAKRVPKPEAPKEVPPAEQMPADPRMAAAVQMAQEQGLVQGDPELQMLDYTSWSSLYGSIQTAGANKRARLNEPAAGQPDADDDDPGPVLPGEIGGGAGASPHENPIENIENPDDLLGMVDWDGLNLPPG